MPRETRRGMQCVGARDRNEIGFSGNNTSAMGSFEMNTKARLAAIAVGGSLGLAVWAIAKHESQTSAPQGPSAAEDAATTPSAEADASRDANQDGDARALDTDTAPDAAPVLPSKPAEKAEIEAPGGGLIGAVEAPVEGYDRGLISTISARDATGALRWETKLGTPPGVVRTSTLLAAEDGGVYFGGSVEEGETLGGRLPAAPRDLSRGVVIKLGPEGQIAWVRAIGGIEGRINETSLVKLSPPLSVAAAAMADRGPNAVLGPPSEAVVLRLEADGRPSKETRLGPDLWAEGLAADANGDLWLSGIFAGAVNLGGTIVRGQGEGFLARIDPAGNVRLGKTTGALHGKIAINKEGQIRVLKGGMQRGKEGVAGRVDEVQSKVDPAPAPIQTPILGIYQFFKQDAGKVLLLQDTRIRKEDHTASCFFWEQLTGLGEDFDSAPLLAAVQLVDADGKELDKRPLEHPLARIDVWKLYEDDRATYAVVENDSICMGSWRGDIVSLYEVHNGKIMPVIAIDEEGKNPLPIRLHISLRGESRIFPARSGKGKDILYVRSGLASPKTPDDGPAFETMLVRFAFENNRWRRHLKTIDGNWMGGEGPGAFPERASFP